MTECYRYAVDTYEQMTDEAKSKISLELLYNAICYYHGDAEGIVQELLRMIRQRLTNLRPRWLRRGSKSKRCTRLHWLQCLP